MPTPQAALVLPTGIGTTCFAPTNVWTVTSGTFQQTFPPLLTPVQFTIQAAVEQTPGVWRITNGVIVDVR